MLSGRMLITVAAAAAAAQAQLLQAIDAVCCHAELLVVHHAAVLTHLLPALSAAGKSVPVMGMPLFFQCKKWEA